VSHRPEFVLHDLLLRSAERDPDRVALVDGEARHTYGDLARCSEALRAVLLGEGVRKGDRVGIYMEKSWEAVVAMLAASQAGAAFVNINPLLKPPQAQYIVRDCEVRVLIGDADKLASLQPGMFRTAFYKGAEAPPAGVAGALIDLAEALRRGASDHRAAPVLETDLGTILYTSGSTGLPKGVALSQRNLVVGAQIVSTYLENTEADRILSALPFSFDYGLNQLTTALRVGATLVLQHSRLPGDLVRSLREHEITGLAGVPPFWPLLLRSAKALQARPLEHLRYITNSGGRIPSAHLEQLRSCLPSTRIYLMYGLTEAFRSTYLPPEELDRGSECIGKPIPNTEIRVLDRAGRECAPGEAGELVHRGPTVALGYWGKEEATRKVFRPSPFAPGELPGVERVVYSGDLVRRDEEGYLYFVGREDHLIKTQGYRLSPEEVESLLVSTGVVREACAFGVPDPQTGQRVVAVVSLRDGGEASVDAIRKHCLENAPPYMVPQEIRVEAELPKTSSGKLDRQVIRDAYDSDR
jgi:acyl-CoA ligase (AMP-forming) (exosortase A-associated)